MDRKAQPEKESVLLLKHNKTTKKTHKDALGLTLPSWSAAPEPSPGLGTAGWARALTVVAGEVLDGHVLDGDLFEEGGLLAARVARHNPFLAEPFSQPRQVAVTVKRIGQQVSERHKQSAEMSWSGSQILAPQSPRLPPATLFP